MVASALRCAGLAWANPFMHPVPSSRLAAFYFAYFGYVGAFSPYFGLYLQDLGHGAAAIGVLLG